MCANRRATPSSRRSKKLNYSPNTAARSLAAGEATHIGMLYANPSAAYLSQFLIGALHAARRAGCHLVIESCESEDADEQAEVTRRFATSDVEGVVLPPPLSESQPIIAELAAIGIPVVTVAMGTPQEDSLNVRIDDFAAAAEMTRYLLSLGHRGIGFIKGHPNHIASHDRARGFRGGLARIWRRPGRSADGAGLFHLSLRPRRQRAAAVATEAADARSSPATTTWRRRRSASRTAAGLTVPGDLSVVGFDDTSLATTVWPELTTVKQPISAMAEAALELLLADLRGRRSGRRRHFAERVLEHELIVRESSSAARRAWVGRSRRSRTAAVQTADAG